MEDSLLCRSLSQGGHFRPGEAELEPKPVEAPSMLMRAPLVGRALCWKSLLMQSYPARTLDRKLQVYWARDAREGPRVLMSLRVDFGPMG